MSFQAFGIHNYVETQASTSRFKLRYVSACSLKIIIDITQTINLTNASPSL